MKWAETGESTDRLDTAGRTPATGVWKNAPMVDLQPQGSRERVSGREKSERHHDG